MACVEKDKRCKICDRLISIARVRRCPTVVLCGGAGTACHTEHYRRRHNRACMLFQRRKRAACRPCNMNGAKT